VEIAFLDSRQHTERHERFLEDPAETDVLAFGYGDPDLFGEILINVDLCRREAAARGEEPAGEALLYAVHGALHLLGFRDGDRTAQAEMRAAEARVLSGILSE